jgi:predicted nucleotidyltransferase
MIDDLTEQLRKALLAEEAIRLAYLFGSVLIDPEFRDVDVAVWAPTVEGITPAARTDSQLRWGAMLERCLRPRRPLDLHLLNGAPLPLQYTVVRTGRLFHVREELERIRYEAATISSYLDFQASLRPFEEAVLARIP